MIALIVSGSIATYLVGVFLSYGWFEVHPGGWDTGDLPPTGLCAIFWPFGLVWLIISRPIDLIVSGQKRYQGWLEARRDQKKLPEARVNK